MAKNIGVTVSEPKRTCDDELCPFHGKLSIRGRILTGITVSSKAHKMIVVSREYPRLVRKYKRYEVISMSFTIYQASYVLLHTSCFSNLLPRSNRFENESLII